MKRLTKRQQDVKAATKAYAANVKGVDVPFGLASSYMILNQFTPCKPNKTK